MGWERGGEGEGEGRGREKREGEREGEGEHERVDSLRLYEPCQHPHQLYEHE